ncbi:MAG: SpoIIE family protein phosphatase [Firmicutes bacterium]|jgi:stage II sporulation protein E|nr:SpoIIE family protein phosphatase [Bacillota bacterium]
MDGTAFAREATSATGGSQERFNAIRAFCRKGQALFSAPNVLLALTGFLLGRAAILGEIAPFGAIFWLMALREKPRQSFLVAAAVLAGRATSGGDVPGAFVLLGAMAAVWFMEGLCLRLFRRRWPLLPATAVLVALNRLPVLLDAPQVLDGAYLLLELIIALLAAVVMLPAMRLIDYLPRSRDRPVAAQEEILALFLIFFLAMFGLKNVTVAGLSVEAAASYLAILLPAYLQGAGWGAAMGIITGTILGLGNPHFYLHIGSLSFSGFWTGLLKPFGRWGSAAGFLFSMPVLFLLAPGEMPGAYWREGLLSLAIFLAIPARMLHRLSLQLGGLGLGEGGEAPEKALQAASGQIRHMAKLFSELSLGFAQATAASHGREEEERSSMLEELMNRVCRSCLFRRRCWEKDLHSHHRLILDLLERAEKEGEATMAHLPAAFRERCHQPEVLVEAVNKLQELIEVNRYWEQRVKEGKELVSGQLRGLAEIMHELARELDENRFPPGVGEQAPLFNMELGLAQKARWNQQVCGDYYSLLELGAGEQVIILSDGMGSGPRAAAESRATVVLLERLLEAGFKKEVVLRSVNSLLQLRTGEESFATVDMALIDLVEGEVELLKIGAAPSLIKRDKEVFRIGAPSLPLGILSRVEVESYVEKLQPNDLLVMVTDGAVDSEGGLDWLLSFLRLMGNSPPQIVADRIVEEAARRSGGRLRDDLTVAVCRLLRLRG